MLGLLFFIFITFFLVSKLSEILGMKIGFKMGKENLRNFSSDYDITEISTSELDRKISEIQKYCPKFDTLDFLNRAKIAFEMIFYAYAKEDLETLKKLLCPRVFDAFHMAIKDRKSRMEVLKGSIERFISSEVLDANISDNSLFITVKFVTEQSNILKNNNGDVIEGHIDFLETRTDIWSFSRKKMSSDSKWLLYEIKDSDA